MMMIIRAFIFAVKAHKGQKDKSGRAYIFHPVHVAKNVKGYKCKVLALLHDVVEDSDYTLESLSPYFDEEIIQALDLLTKKPDTKYKDYIAKIKANDLARRVKIADLNHNMDLNRLKEVRQKDVERVEKYKKAIKILKEG